jgi:amidase
VPHTGAIAFDPVLDHLGPMTRTVEDCAKMLTAIAGPDGLDPRQGNCRAADYLTDLHSGVEGMRIGILAEGFDWPGVIDQNVADTVRAAAQSYRDLGAQVCEVSVPWHPKGLTLLWAIVTEATSNSITMETAGAGSRGHYPLDAVDFYSSARRARANEFPHTVKVSALLGQWASERYGRRYYTKAMNLLPVLKEAYDQALNSVDVLVMPTMLFRAPPKPKEQATVYERIQLMANMIQNTGPFNLSGHPALTIPCRVLEGLPVGMQIVGSHFDEAKLLRIARAYEAKGAAS